MRRGSRRQTLPASRFESHTDPRPTRTASPPLPANCCTTALVDGSMRESGNSNAVTHTEPSPTAISPPPPGHADLDRRDDLVGLRIDARHAAVALVQRPHRAAAGGDEAGRLADRNRLDDEVGPRIDARDRAVLGARHPDGVLAEREAVRSGRDVDFRDHGVGRGIEARQRALGVGHQPDAAGAGDDRPFGVADGGLDRRRDRAGLEIDAASSSDRRNWAPTGCRSRPPRRNTGALPTSNGGRHRVRLRDPGATRCSSACSTPRPPRRSPASRACRAPGRPRPASGARSGS